jgi:exopolyphosphatase / guanosine-5'-triphosphate,3'-diphosphate pyrophosphatase
VEMRIGVIDVGSNTTRLLVADADSDGLVPLDKAKVRLGLGEEIERYGAVSAVHLAAAAKAVRSMAAAARRKRVVSLDVFLTAPGRQAANADALVAALTRAAGVQARVLTKEEEGTLAYRGAVLTAGMPLPSRIAVCDIGGASTEIAVGDPSSEPKWIESVDLGSVRLTARAGNMKKEARHALACLEPPAAEAALAVGGSARAARRLVGAVLGESDLAEALRLVETSAPREIADCYGVDRARAAILPAGVILLAEVQRKLGVPLRVCSGGIREGAVLASREALAA